MIRFPHDALRAENVVNQPDDAGAAWTRESLLLVRTAVNAMAKDIAGGMQHANTAQQD